MHLYMETGKEKVKDISIQMSDIYQIQICVQYALLEPDTSVHVTQVIHLSYMPF